MARYTLWEAVAPCWHDVLFRTGMPADPSPQQASPRGWAVRPDVVEAIARRAAGETVSALAADLGIDRRNLSGRLTTAVPALLAPWLHDVPAWRLGREQGHSLGELAELYEVPEHLIGVALDGWPDPSPSPEDVAAEVLQLWRDGADLDGIAAQIEVPPARLRRWAQEGSVRLTPARLRTSEIVERFGWSHHMAALYRDSGVLPAPDGGKPPWWWSTTIARLERGTFTHQCEECGARLASAKGVAIHRGRVHGPAV
ncbi:hypothetical protein L6241_09990 [Janibacter sp. Y6]|uniref:hypothetical protein n=1 Tax=Janibacter sp. Y6 TaxID=2913552 RepID=UPI0034A16AFA